MTDPAYADTRLAAIYDALDPDRSDLDAYVAIATEFAARRVLDLGCGTGTLAIRLARLGVDVTGVDPAAASVEVARRKPFADVVRWVDGDASTLARRLVDPAFDLAVMTGNAAQGIVSDEAWNDTLVGVHAMLADGGRFVFETRIPERRAWEGWNGPAGDVEVPGIGRVSDSYEVLSVDELEGGDVTVTFSSPTRFHGSDGAADIVIESTSTLRFRSRSSIDHSLEQAGFVVDDVRDAPDRPGLEWVVIARRT